MIEADGKTNPDIPQFVFDQSKSEESSAASSNNENNTDKATSPTIQELGLVPPEANDDIYSMNKDGVLAINLLSNDSGDNISFILLTQPLYGSLSQNGNDGNYIYTPGANFYGIDSFTYQISNSAGSDIATAIINIKNPINDAPINIAIPKA